MLRAPWPPARRSEVAALALAAALALTACTPDRSTAPVDQGPHGHGPTADVASATGPVVAVGTFQSELGCPSDWAPDCLRSSLEDPDGDGLSAFATDAIPAGVHEVKVALGGSWAENYGADGAPGGANIVFFVAENGSRVSFQYDAATHVLTVVASAPALAQTITSASAAPAPAYLHGTYAVDASASSGLPVAVSAGPAGVCTASAGVVTFVGVGTCTVSADQAGDDRYEPAAQVTQTIAVDYRFEGFVAPVDNGGVANRARAGQAIPLKWRLTDASGTPVTTLASATVTVVGLACELGGDADALEAYAGAGSGLQNLGGGYYQLDWKSPATYARSCKTLRLDLGEGSGPRTALFQFTK
jgi:hypothetical protein